MKQFDDIDMQELERIASDSTIETPRDLRGSLERSLDMLAFVDGVDERKPRFRMAWASVAAAAAILLGVGLGLGTHSHPKDTFSDPYLAYNELEAAFELISSKMDRGVTIAQDATNQLVNLTNDIIEKI